MSGRDVRYGAEIRKQADKVRAAKCLSYACPTCGKVSVRRTSNAKWTCKSCGSSFAGGAYALSTPAGDASNRLLSEYKKR